PLFPLGAQSGAWTVGYGVLILLVAGTALARRKSAVAPIPKPENCIRKSAKRPSHRPVAGAIGGPIRTDAVDNHAPHHRYLRNAAVVGDPARALPAVVLDRLRRKAGPGADL